MHLHMAGGVTKAGDAIVWDGVEECDDGNDSNTDACLSSCVEAFCGDGVRYVGVEECDDGNDSNTDACLSSCVEASCGDGFVRDGVEECDDGNRSDCDGCHGDCSLLETGCGDGIICGDELCDSTNLDGFSCLDFGDFSIGTLSCDDFCEFDTSECTYGLSCDDILSDDDGYYIIDPDGEGSNPAFEVYCADMDTDDPQEYIELAVTGGHNNWSLRYYTTVGSAVECNWTRIRIENLETLEIDNNDRRFATCTEGVYVPRWGRASSCRCGGCPYGQMNLDLTGTPFVIDYEGGAHWEIVGCSPAGEVTLDEGPGRIVEANGEGFCGDTRLAPDPGYILTFWEE